jgi:hypothetical protein
VLTVVELRDRLLELAQAYAELEARQSACPLAFYEPHPKQQEFHDSTAPIVILMGGNQSGKTHANVAELQAAALGYRPWRVPGFQLVDGQFPARNDVPASAWVRRRDGLPISLPAHILVVTGLSISRGIGEIIQAKWHDLWPSTVKVKPLLGPLGAWQKLLLPNGSEITFGAASQSNLAFEGFIGDLVLIDEPIPRRIFPAVRRGLMARRGQLRWTLTPLGGAETVWMASDLIEAERADVHLIKCASRENPYLDPEILAEFLADPAMSADERRAREFGELAALGRTIVSTFGDHALLEPTSVDHTVPRLCVIDPHHARLPVVLWLALFNEGRDIVVYREWPEVLPERGIIPRTTMAELAATIKALEGRENIMYRICDPAFGVQHAKVLGQQFPSFVEQMAEFGLHFDTRVDNDIERGIGLLREAFTTDPLIQRPPVQIFRNCRNLIKSLAYWSYAETNTGILKPSEQFKDFVDCLRYGLAYIRNGLPLLKDSWTYNDD